MDQPEPTSEAGQIKRAETTERIVRTIGGRNPAAVILTFIVGMITWIVLSGRFDAFHLVLGIISSAGMAWLSSDLLFSRVPTPRLLTLSIRFLAYLPWLLYEVVLANLHLLKIVFSPRMNELIDPHVVRFHSNLKSDMSLVTLANSITLTPGTITIYVTLDGSFSVHAISKPAGDISALRKMEAKVAFTFGENDG